MSGDLQPSTGYVIPEAAKCTGNPSQPLIRKIQELTFTDSQGKQFYSDFGVRRRLRSAHDYANLNQTLDTYREFYQRRAHA